MSYELGRRNADAVSVTRPGSVVSVSARDRLTGWAERRAFVRMLERVPGGGTVLNLATGADRFTDVLLAQGYTVGFADVAGSIRDRSEAIAIIKQGLMLFLHQGDVAHLPLADRTFDGIACMGAYRQVPSATRVNMLREVQRVGSGWAILSFRLSSSCVESHRTARATPRPPRGVDAAVLSPAGLQRELQEAGLTLRARENILPFLAEDVVTLVTW